MIMGATGNFAQLFLTRVGVGIGEAGCVPPSHAIISDAVSKEKRGSALAFFSAGTNVGIFLSFLVGGIVAAQFGWRMAFLVAGAPGILLAIALLFLLREPDRPKAVDVPTPSKGNTYKSTVQLLLKQKSSRHVIAGSVLTSVVGFGAIAWIATFLARTHDMELPQIGLYLAFVIGVFGALGTWMGGVLSDRIGKSRPDWRLKFVSLSVLIAKPLSILFYLSDNLGFALALFVIPAAVGSMFTGPAFAHVYSKVEPEQRPMVTAIMMFLFNLIGLGLGPVLVGFVSDFLATSIGEDSLRYAMVLLQFAGLWAAVHFWIAGNAAKQEIN